MIARILGLALCLAAAACAPSVIPQARMEPRLAYQGFSFERPPSDSWFLRRSEEIYTRVVLRRSVPGEPRHTFYAIVGLDALERQPETQEEFAELARPGPDRTAYPIERKSQSQTLVTRQGQWCLRYEWTDVTSASPVAPGQELTTLSRGYRCLHPAFPKTVLQFSWSERGPASELDPSVQAEGERFLDGVRIDVAPDTPAR